MSTASPQPEYMSRQLADSSTLSKDVEEMPKPLGWFIWCCVLLSMVSTMLMGNIDIMSGETCTHLSLFEEEVILGSLNLFAAFGSPGHRLHLKSSRLTLRSVGLFCSLPCCWILICRLLIGLGVGFAMMIAALYSAEISPACVRVRGFLVSFTEVFMMGYIFGFAMQFLSSTYNWRLMLGARALPAVILAVGVLFLLSESPRWLVLQGRNEEAKHMLTDVVCGKDEVEVQQRLQEIMVANEEEGLAGRGRRRRRVLQLLQKRRKAQRHAKFRREHTALDGVAAGANVCGRTSLDCSMV